MKKKIVLAGMDATVFAASFAVSSRWFDLDSSRFWLFLGLFVVTKLFFLMRSGLYHAILRYAGLPLAAEVIKSIFYATLLCFFIIHFPTPQKIPVGFFFTDFLASAFFVGLIRFAPRYFHESFRDSGSKKLLIYGAGELGETVARKLLRVPGEYQLIGFIDDSATKIGKRLHNLPIFGPIGELGAILSKERVSELVIAISTLPGEVVREITHECRRHGVFCRIVPSFSNMMKKDVSIKNIDIADLLKRDPKDLDEAQIRRFLNGKTIMISGAGGSIGSELSRQCIRYGAKKLILIDHSEFNLYAVQEELSDSEIPIRFCLLNILSGPLDKVMEEERPEIFFHAAAYKHVPIVEENPGEGVINNVEGTVRAAQLAEKSGVHKFILISTDKAVRPTSVMGASKRIAELFIQNLDLHSRTEYLAVRFGNVLGSSGSVIPKFLEQINSGGPVTVTHPDVTRYFMLTSEAVQLVLQAASIGNGGEIFILNMGNPVRIADMAEDIIFLSGREPHKDIQIEFTGLRPGEKLYEELLMDETEKKTQYENITIARATPVHWERLNVQIEELLTCARQANRHPLLLAIKRMIPEFMHGSLEPEARKDVIPFRRSI